MRATPAELVEDLIITSGASAKVANYDLGSPSEADGDVASVLRCLVQQVPALVVARSMSRPAALLCELTGTSWVDRSGNGALRLSDVHVCVLGNPDRTGPATPKRGRPPKSGNLDILRCLLEAREPLTNNEIARRCAINRGTVSRDLRPHVESGIVREDGSEYLIASVPAGLLAIEEAYDPKVYYLDYYAFHQWEMELPFCDYGSPYRAYLCAWDPSEGILEQRWTGTIDSAPITLVVPDHRWSAPRDDDTAGAPMVDPVQTYLDLSAANAPARLVRAAWSTALGWLDRKRHQTTTTRETMSNETPDRPPKWVRPKDFADQCELHVDTVYRLLAAGEIPGAFRIGKTWLIDLEVFRDRVTAAKEE